MKEKKTFVMSDDMREIVIADAERVFKIKDYKGNGIVIIADSVIAKIEKAMTDILYNDGKKTRILQDGNGKIDDSVLCQAIFPVITCPCHCPGCYAVNACTKKFNGIGRQTAEAWYKWYFIEKYFPEAYFAQVDRELSASDSDECRWHVSGDYIDETDVQYCIKLYTKHNDKQFYTYTKRDAERDNMPSLPILMALENVNVVDSKPCGMLNFGDDEYLKRLIEKIEKELGEKAFICECGTEIEKAFNKEHSKKNGGDGQKYCGGRDGCKACRDCKYILFHKHN